MSAVRFFVRFIVVASGLAAMALFAALVVLRLRHPAEIEWTGGSILEQVERVRQGRALYVAPGADYVPFMRPPLQIWIAALLGRWMSLVTATRAVSIASTVLAGGFVYALSRTLEARRVWSLVAVGLLFSGAAIAGFSYDLERSEMLSTAMVLGGACIACRWPSAWGFFFAGLVTGAAFFARQSAIAFAVWPALVMLVGRRWRRAGALVIGAAIGFAPLWSVLHQTSDGWFTTYCIVAPFKQGMDASALSAFVVDELGRGFLLVAVSLVAVGVGVRDTIRSVRGDDVDPQEVYFGGSIMIALAVAVVGRLAHGGWLEGLAIWIAFAAVAVAKLGSLLEYNLEHDEENDGVILGAMLAVLGQSLHLAYDPRAHSPSGAELASQRALEASVRRLEGGGDVLVEGRGFVSSHRHAHPLAVAAAARAGLAVADDLGKSVDERKLAACFLRDPFDLALDRSLGMRGNPLERLGRSYFVSARIDGEPGADPIWQLRPRVTPLTGRSAKEIEHRVRLEVALAESRARMAALGVRSSGDGFDLEAAAAQADDASK